jgi:hypothetical protein
LVAKDDIPALNNTIVQNSGVLAGPNDIAQQIHSMIISKEREARGLPQPLVTTKYFCHTLEKYVNAAASQQPGIELVKNVSTARTQGTRREMASLSERNLCSHIAAVLDFHYVPGDWTDKQPSNLSAEGANLGHKLIEAARGMKMRPVATYLITNYDNTAYYHMGSLGSDRNGGIQWTREVSSADTLLVRVSAESVARGKTQELTLSRRGVKSFHVLESR